MRKKINKNWKFHKGDIEHAEGLEFNDAFWEDIQIPHDYTIEGPFNKNFSRWNGYLPKGTGWYRKYIQLPDELSAKRIYLEFEGIFRKGNIWVNGRFAALHQYGYTGKVLDVTNHIHTGGKPNLIAVKVDNSDYEGSLGGLAHIAGSIPDFPDEREASEGWWYEGCGIYRNVWLIAVPQIHIIPWGIFVTTPKVSEKHTSISIQTTLQNSMNINTECVLETSIIDPHGSTVLVIKNECNLSARSKKDVLQKAEIQNPLLWAPDTPRLYTAVSRLINKKEVHTYETRFGIRWFEFTADNGFFLNGKHGQLRGVNIHHDFGALGVALPDRAHVKNVELLKEMGCNIIRSAHNDAAPALMDACDRLGMLFWAETRYLDRPEISVPPLIDLIHRNRNHPSIICWSLANTAGDKNGNTIRTEYLKILHKTAQDNDPTRPTAFACEQNADPNKNGFAFVTDIVGYNGSGLSGQDDRDHVTYPERKLLITEYTGGCSVGKNRGSRGQYQEMPGESSVEYWPCGYKMPYNSELCSIYDLCLAHEDTWPHIARREWLAGGLMWAGIDYWGESTGWPNVTSQFGVFDLCRFRKDTYYYYKQEWTDNPFVHIFPHWNWPGREGQEISIWCYTGCDTVELLLNGSSLGTKPRIPFGHIEWKVPFKPGQLLAIGYKNNQAVCKTEINTSGMPAKLTLESDRLTIGADNEDLCFITVKVLDKHNVPLPTADNIITIRIDQGGRLLGLGNGDPRCHQNPKTDTMNLYHGLLLAVVQSSAKAGEITIMAESKGMESAMLTVKKV